MTVTKDMVNKNKLPTKYFPCYVKYTTNGQGPYVVGFDSKELAEHFLATNPKLTNTEIREEYPWEMILEWEKKDKKGKSNDSSKS